MTASGAPTSQRYRGERIGLPSSGPGSLAPFGRRLLAFVIDVVLSIAVAGLFVRHNDLPGFAAHLPGQWSAIPFFFEYVLGLLVLGRSVGMWLTGLRVIRIDAREAVGPLRAATRTVLLLLLLPAVVADADFRGLQDRLTDTAVIVH